MRPGCAGCLTFKNPVPSQAGQITSLKPSRDFFINARSLKHDKKLNSCAKIAAGCNSAQQSSLLNLTGQRYRRRESRGASQEARALFPVYPNQRTSQDRPDWSFRANR